VQQRIHNTEEQNLAVQQDVRMAQDLMAQELRQAGFWLCVDPEKISSGHASVKNTVNADPTLQTHPVWGWNNITDATDPFSDNETRPGSDVLGYSFADPSFEADLAEDQNLPSADIKIVKTPFSEDLEKGDIVLITDCRNTAIFQITNISTPGSNVNVVHNTGAGTPGNNTKCLKCDDGTNTCIHSNECNLHGTGYKKGEAKLFRLQVGYFRLTDAGELQWLTGTGDDSTTSFNFSKRTLAENVEDFQVEYGVDTDTTADGVLNAWVSADGVGDLYPADNNTDWHRVTAVRLHVLGRTKRQEKDYRDTHVYNFADRDNGTWTYNDGYHRFYLQRTVVIRNAVP